MEGRCSCDPAKHVFSAGCVYGDPRPTPPGCARVVVCRVATSPYKCSSEYHHIAETDMRGVNVLTVPEQPRAVVGETERLTSIPYTNPVGSDHMGVLLDINPDHWRYPTIMNISRVPPVKFG